MIKKYYELNKLNLSEFSLYLLHGKNEGLKYNLIETLTKDFKGQINKYEENEFIDNFTIYYLKLTISLFLMMRLL